jgi:hypothetical protein
MTTLTLSIGKPLGFYSQSLSDKLFPHLSNGERLSLTDAIRLTELCGYASIGILEDPQETDDNIGTFINGMEFHKRGGSPWEPEEFDGFDWMDLKDVVLSLEEWLSLSRWSSELAELRHRDYQRAAKSTLTPGQKAAPWVSYEVAYIDSETYAVSGEIVRYPDGKPLERSCTCNRAKPVHCDHYYAVERALKNNTVEGKHHGR